MAEMEMADCIGVPEYFATHVKTEDAGGGCIRIYGCIVRRGMFVPVYAAVFPTGNVISASLAIQEAARDIFLATAVGHH